ncbi:hypothetical protein J2Z42_001419 [Clostridium algifaecis]|uniref:Permease n=1 Tax=Clostridium algifaecis TaxID=1472040 RepID=A0ABS4KRU4_9CLOT|nr:DUF6803 family protein [Clostridium algifaecis]MBP2032745.1 hypothetical protein [Clostridium algifaecis]
MNTTHYMSLLMNNQPWNLIIFMAIPVICAEFLTITEFFIIYNKIEKGGIKALNKAIGIFDGIYFTIIFIYLMVNAVIPLTTTNGWHTWVDVLAVLSYLSGVIFLVPITLMELGIIFKTKSTHDKLKIHFILIGGFLIVAHVAMIFGMVNPQIINSMPGMKM